jgi:hypothetical protein
MQEGAMIVGNRLDPGSRFEKEVQGSKGRGSERE